MTGNGNKRTDCSFTRTRVVVIRATSAISPRISSSHVSTGSMLLAAKELRNARVTILPEVANFSDWLFWLLYRIRSCASVRVVNKVRGTAGYSDFYRQRQRWHCCKGRAVELGKYRSKSVPPLPASFYAGMLGSRSVFTLFSNALCVPLPNLHQRPCKHCTVN